MIEEAPSLTVTNNRTERQGRWALLAQRLLSALTVLLVVVALASVALWFWPADADLYLPAKGVRVDTKITVSDHPPVANRGAFYMLFIYNQHVTNKLEELLGHLNADATLVPIDHVTGLRLPTPQQEEQYNKYLMLSSEQYAKYIAAAYLGDKYFAVRGVMIRDVYSWSAAWKNLEPGDVILEAAGHPITSQKGLIAIVHRAGSGARLPLVIQRQDRRFSVAMRVGRNPGPGKLTGQPAIGITIIPNVDVSSIKIQAGDIGGPSAGLAFTLDILQHYSKTDLTHNHHIAVTGTIEGDGSVGPIGGVKQKTIGAQWAGAEYFILPAGDNYKEARPYAHGLKLVPVHSLSEALAFLKTLH